MSGSGPPRAQALAANASSFAPGPVRFDPEAELERCRELGVTPVFLGEPLFPPLLAAVDDPPRVLYVRGDPGFAKDPAVPAALAIVGSRRPTPYGRRMARRLASEAAKAGLAVVSGLARGIDTEAHRAALEAGGLTWAVLGSGLDRPYPPENAGLARDIAARGGVVASEAPLSCPPVPENFPRRNRVISGLAWAAVVVEGTATSGALITAKTAVNQGREVFAVPGPADSPLSEGPHRLLEAGAGLAACLGDVLRAVPELRRAVEARARGAAAETFSAAAVPGARRIGAPGTTGEVVLPSRGATAAPGAAGGAQTPPRAVPSTPEQEKILELMGSEPAGFEELLRDAGAGAGELSRLLLELELQGLIESHPGQRYARR